MREKTQTSQIGYRTGVPYLQLSSAILSSLLIAVACQGESGQESEAPTRQPRNINVEASQVSYETDTTRIEAVGTARARASATIQPEVSGEVTEINFTSGDHVEKGEVLVRLESRAEQLAVEQAPVARKAPSV